MATLLLRGVPIGTIQGVLFDKDGTLSHSEPHLLDLAERRIQIAEELWNCQAPSPKEENTLRPVLRRAFGIQGEQLHPGGTLAVAARQDNLTTMATVFCLHGCSWPSAIALAQSCFDQCDQQEHDRNSISPLLDGAKTSCAACIHVASPTPSSATTPVQGSTPFSSITASVI